MNGRDEQTYTFHCPHCSEKIRIDSGETVVDLLHGRIEGLLNDLEEVAGENPFVMLEERVNRMESILNELYRDMTRINERDEAEARSTLG